MFFLPFQAQAVIDWHLEWHKGDDYAELFVFNPESQEQSLVLETGDRVRLDNITALNIALEGVILDDFIKTFDLLIGEDVRFKLPPHARRSKMQVTVYLVDNAALGNTGLQSSQTQIQNGTSSRALVPTPRDSTMPLLIYRKVIDHEYDAEQLIRTGQKLGSGYFDVQDVLLYLFQRTQTLTVGAQPIWDASFPELRAPEPTPLPSANLVVTYVASNRTASPRDVSIKIGDILEPADNQYGRVIAGEDINFIVNPYTESYTQLIAVYELRNIGVTPTQNTVYTAIVGHDDQLARIIQIGTNEGFSSAAIQNVIFNRTMGLPLDSEGQALAQRLGTGGGGGGGGQPGPSSGCFSPFLSHTTYSYSTGANLIMLAGILIPLQFIAKRRIKRK
jgi:hypothetical protein